MNNSTNKKIDIRKYYKMLWKRKYLIIFPFVGILSVSIWYAFKQKPIYECYATIQIGKPKLMSRELSRITPQISAIERFDILKGKILSKENLSTIIKKLNLKNNPKIKNDAKAIQAEYKDLSLDEIMTELLINRLKKQISIFTKRNSFITITARGGNRNHVYLIVKTLSEEFINSVIEEEYDSMRDLIEFNAQQLKIYEKKLNDSEAKLNEYEQLFNSKPTERSLISSKLKLDQYNLMLDALNDEIARKKGELNELDITLTEKGYDYNFPSSSNLNNLASQYITAGEKISMDDINLSSQDVNVIWSIEKIDLLRRQIIEEIKNIARSKLAIKDDNLFQLIVLEEIVKRDLALLRKISDRFALSIEKHGNVLAQRPEQEVSLDKLKQEVDVNREIYNTFLKQSQASFIVEEMQKREASYKFKIVEPPVKPMGRANSRKKVAAIGALFGVLVSFGLFTLFEYLDNSFTDITEIEDYLQLPVVGTVARLNFLCKPKTKYILYLAIAICSIFFIVYIVIK